MTILMIIYHSYYMISRAISILSISIVNRYTHILSFFLLFSYLYSSFTLMLPLLLFFLYSYSLIFLSFLSSSSLLLPFPIRSSLSYSIFPYFLVISLIPTKFLFLPNFLSSPFLPNFIFSSHQFVVPDFLLSPSSLVNLLISPFQFPHHHLIL